MVRNGYSLLFLALVSETAVAIGYFRSEAHLGSKGEVSELSGDYVRVMRM